MLSYKQRSHWLWLRMTPCGICAAPRGVVHALFCIALRSAVNASLFNAVFRCNMPHAAGRRRLRYELGTQLKICKKILKIGPTFG